MDFSPVPSVRLSNGLVTITETRSDTKVFPGLNNEWSGQCSNQREYEAVQIALQPAAVRISRLNDFHVEFVLPVAYADALQEVRTLRQMADRDPNSVESDKERALIEAAECQLLAHGYGNRALPEDLLPLLQSMPIPDLINQIELLDNRDPSEHGHQQFLAPGNSFRFQDAEKGSIRFYALERPGFGDRDLNYSNVRMSVCWAWAHFLRRALRLMGRNVETQFLRALRLEPLEANWGIFAVGLDLDDPWLVLVAGGFLHPDASFFRDVVVKRNPLKTSLIAQALMLLLQRDGPRQLSSTDKAVMDRIEFVTAEVLPQVQRQLLAAVNSSVHTGMNYSLVLLSELTQGEALQEMRPRTEIVLTDSHVSVRILQILGAMPSLKTLSLAGTNVTADMLGSLESTQIERLNISRTRTGDDALEAIRRLRALKELDISTTSITRQAVTRLRSDCPEVKVIYY